MAPTLILKILPLVLAVVGEEVTLKVNHPALDDHFRCVLPSTLNVKVERQGIEEKIPQLFLAKREVVPSTRHVKLVKRDTDGVLRFYHHDVHELKVLATQAYHNHSVGASFIVNCVLSDIGRLYLRLVSPAVSIQPCLAKKMV
ncbi:hypothetical protein ElyMa_001994700 [Elysia marginata]|uniref:Uncharacterized protein n=1 Tax=Elysia marginata TaxID=1093978 RepID=A0AAV4F310_9GAST|nr:hypothetical protein ElyMa_001994700 [Elysia marginata]